MKVLQVNRLVERENLRRESLESPAISVLRLAVGECQLDSTTATKLSDLCNEDLEPVIPA